MNGLNLIEKAFRRGILIASTLVVPRGCRDIRLYKGRDFDLLVRANEDIGRQLMFLGSYERRESEYLREHVSPYDICVDVGGNVGYFTLLLASVASQGTVHVFEPIPSNAALIRTSLVLNDISNVCVNECAIGDLPGNAAFSVSLDSAFSSMRATGRIPEAARLSVPMVSLDSYVHERNVPRVDVLKIDVEGAEGMVISGAGGLLGDKARRPRMVMIELHDPNLLVFGASAAELIARMAAFGYVPWVFRGSSGGLELYDSRRHSRFFSNVLFRA